LFFTKDAGSTAPGEPYVARFPDEHGNVKTRKVARQEVISRYFGASNVVDSHNQSRQYCLKLMKLWVTQDPWFRIDSTIIGMTVVDCWQSLKLQSNNKAMRALQMVNFVDRLASDLLNNEMNSELHIMIVPSVSTAGSASNSVPSAISMSDSS
jgi:hypothetical protein